VALWSQAGTDNRMWVMPLPRPRLVAVTGWSLTANREIRFCPTG
jgi:hypothetical protein